MSSKIITLQQAADMRKLEGWTIRTVETVAGVSPALRLSLTHPAAENPVLLTITPIVGIGLNGNLMVANVDLRMALDDLPV